jgi:hypothetical protein
MDIPEASSAALVEGMVLHAQANKTMKQNQKGNTNHTCYLSACDLSYRYALLQSASQ